MSASNPTVTALGAGRFLVADGVRQQVAYGIRGREGTWVFLDGRAWLVEDEATTRRRAAGGNDDAALASPMPATVVLVNVAPGQDVKAGDLLIMLEAMKMELAITASRDGKVKAIHCRKGDLVQPGVALLALE